MSDTIQGGVSETTILSDKYSRFIDNLANPNKYALDKQEFKVNEVVHVQKINGITDEQDLNYKIDIKVLDIYENKKTGYRGVYFEDLTSHERILMTEGSKGFGNSLLVNNPVTSLVAALGKSAIKVDMTPLANYIKENTNNLTDFVSNPISSSNKLLTAVKNEPDVWRELILDWGLNDGAQVGAGILPAQLPDWEKQVDSIRNGGNQVDTAIGSSLGDIIASTALQQDKYKNIKGVFFNGGPPERYLDALEASGRTLSGDYSNISVYLSKKEPLSNLIDFNPLINMYRKDGGEEGHAVTTQFNTDGNDGTYTKMGQQGNNLDLHIEVSPTENGTGLKVQMKANFGSEGSVKNTAADTLNVLKTQLGTEFDLKSLRTKVLFEVKNNDDGTTYKINNKEDLRNKYGTTNEELDNANAGLASKTSDDETIYLTLPEEKVKIPTEAINHATIGHHMTSIIGIENPDDTTTNDIGSPLNPPVDPAYYTNLKKPTYVRTAAPGGSSRNWLKKRKAA